MGLDRMTSINLPGDFNCGLAEYGRKTVPEMIKVLRDYATRQKEQAEKMLAASDEDFRVETYLGVYAMRNTEVLQQGRRALAQRQE